MCITTARGGMGGSERPLQVLFPGMYPLILPNRKLYTTGGTESVQERVLMCVVAPTEGPGLFMSQIRTTDFCASLRWKW